MLSQILNTSLSWDAGLSSLLIDPTFHLNPVFLDHSDTHALSEWRSPCYPQSHETSVGLHSPNPKLATTAGECVTNHGRLCLGTQCAPQQAQGLRDLLYPFWGWTAMVWWARSKERGFELEIYELAPGFHHKLVMWPWSKLLTTAWFDTILMKLRNRRVKKLA